MRFLSMLITLVIIAYGISAYLETGQQSNPASPLKTSTPKKVIDHAQQTANQVTESLKRRQQKLEHSN